jgi:glycosyltransferase involved in cell wall biosynthesis
MIQGVAIVATLLNEEAALPEFLDSLQAQTRTPDEIILVDGGSSDKSCEIIRNYIAKGMRINLIEAPKANRSKGRNVGIQAAKQPIIAVCDVGCRCAPDWLEKIVAPLEHGKAEVACGYYQPEAVTLIERAVAAATVPSAQEVDPKTFLPSSRSVAFLHEAWERAGGYPEYTPEAEDTLFDMHLKEGGERFVFVPEALVFWRQQGSLTKTFRQFYRYARADGSAGLAQGHYRKVFFLFTWLLGLAAVTILAGVAAPWLLGAPLLLIVLTLAGYFIRYAWRARRRGYGWGTALLAPLAMGVVDAANYLGYRVGMRKQKKS